VVRLGPRPPSPLAPWQALQEVANSFRPAATASGWPANGFRSEGESGRGYWAQRVGKVTKSAQMCRIDNTTPYHEWWLRGRFGRSDPILAVRGLLRHLRHCFLGFVSPFFCFTGQNLLKTDQNGRFCWIHLLIPIIYERFYGRSPNSPALTLGAV